MTAFSERLASVAGDIEAVLEAIFETTSDPPVPSRLLAAMRHATLGGGKRLRPFLVVETAAMLGGDPDASLRAGAAIELLHVYSLVHDDLPAMDDDDLRRGKPTVHKAFDEATAILAGDALQTLAFETLSDPATHADAGVRAAMVLALARAAGPAGMAGGQMLDLEAESHHTGAAAPMSADAVRHLQAMKTGALLGCAVDLGALVGGADGPTRLALGNFGRGLGAAFQVADDILDVEATASALGKAAGKDAGRGKATLVAALGLSEAKGVRNQLAEGAIAALDGFGDEADGLRGAARFAVDRTW